MWIVVDVETWLMTQHGTLVPIFHLYLGAHATLSVFASKYNGIGWNDVIAAI